MVRVEKRRHVWWVCISAGALLFLSGLPACVFGTSCSDGRKAQRGDDGPCTDSTHFMTCVGGEGYEHDQEKACPSDAPLCVPTAWGDHQCKASE